MSDTADMAQSSARRLVEELKALDIALWVDGGDLRYSAPPGAFQPDMQARLRGCKEEVVRYLQEQAGDHESPAQAPGPEGLFRASPGQEALWAARRDDPESVSYSVLFPLELPQGSATGDIAGAIRWLARRHDAMRCVFAEEDGQLFVRLADAHAPTLTEHDLKGRADARAAIRATLAADAARPFDLKAGPLFRFHLFRTGEADHLHCTADHLVVDGMSVAILRREFASTLDAIVRGRTPALPPLPLDWTSCLARQRAELDGGRGETLRQVWGEAMRDLAWNDLSADAAPLEGAPVHARRHMVPMKPETIAAFKALALEARATPVMAWAGLVGALLAHHKPVGSDVVLGLPFSGRADAALEPQVGYFANVLPVPLRAPGGATLTGLLTQARGALVRTLAIQDYPLSRLVDDLARSDSGAPRQPFDAVVTLEEIAPQDGDLMDTSAAMGKFELMFGLMLGDDGGALMVIEHDERRFAPERIARMARQLETLVASSGAGRDVAVAALDILAPDERARVHGGFNPPAIPEPLSGCVASAFEAVAARQGDRTALQWDGESLTYAELNRRADALAARLARQGVTPGETLGLAVERNGEAVIAMLAAVKAGAAYLPLDPKLPVALAEKLMAVSGANRILADARGCERLAALSGRVAVLATAAADGDTALSPVRPTADSARRLYVMFTSGSTGEPKGVVISHRNVLHLLRGIGQLGLGPDDVTIQNAPLGFDGSTLEIWGTLLSGGRLVIAPDDIALEPRRFGALLARAGGTAMWLTTSLMNRIADEAPEVFRPLRLLMTGGEALSPTHIRRVMAACPRLRLYNGYGPTENTVFTTLHAITAEDALGEAIPIGRPLANGRAYVVDAGGAPTPIGVWGELLAAGDGLAEGYAGRPDLTDTAFGHFLPWKPEERVYRTGDIARWRADGVLEFGGRRDGQVKVRGHRVEIGAIEAVLAAEPGVKDAAVLVIGAGSDRALAAVVASSAPDEAGWRLSLAQRLPAYMVPGRFLMVPELPVNANGKKDRARIAALLDAPAAPAPARAAPAGSAEDTVARLFADLFPGADIGPDSDFFALGGHSLLAMRLAERIERACGTRLPIRDILTARTVAAIAARLPATAARAAPVRKTEENADFPLSAGQQRLWVLQRLSPDSGAYNVPLSIAIEGRLDTAAFDRALARLEERQHALRLRIHDDGAGNARQKLMPAGSLKATRIDLAAEADPEAEARRHTEAGIAKPFDLTREGPARVTLFRLGEGSWQLLLVLHHSACDGWSMPVLWRDLTAFYAAETGGVAAGLPALSEHYEDYARRQRAHLASPEGTALLERWTARLTPLAEPLDLPTDHARPQARSQRGGSDRFMLAPGVALGVERLAETLGVTPFAVLAAALTAFLHRHTGQTDIALGTLLAGRDRASTSDLVGFFVNTLVLRQTAEPDMPLRALIEATRDTLLDAMSDGDCPFEAVVDAVKAPRDPSRNPLFDVLAVWQDGDRPAMHLAGADHVRLMEPPFPFAKFDLGFHFFRNDGKLGCELEYAADLFEASTITTWIARFQALIADAVVHPDRPLRDLALMPDGEAETVLRAFNATDRDLPVRRTIPELLLDQAAATPDATALISEEGVLDYAAFVRRAAGIAATLAASGVCAGDTVLLCTRRSPAMLAAVHGILLAGAGYAPVDPDQPPARLANMLEDLGTPPVLVAPEHAHLFEGHAAPVILLDGSAEAAPPSLADLTPDDLAYVIFTSGSTGRPKGVAIEHHAVLNRILWMQEAFGIGPGDVILQKTPHTFDVSVWELLWWSWTGAAVAVPPVGVERDPPALAGAIERFGVTVMHFVPSMLAAFLAFVEDGRVPAEKLASLRTVFASGEALDLATVERFNALLHTRFGTELHNLYGPTEATVDVTWQPCSPWTGGALVPIGKPIANTRLYVLDEALRPLPIGVAGELYIGGPQVARGYVNRPDLTAERFLDDPFAPGGRLYRTSDRALWRADGSVMFLGRADHQVKVRGYRIEPGEIEQALERHDLVDRAVVVPVTAGGLTELHGYVLPKGEDAPSAATLRTHLRALVPDYMVPARFWRLAELPLTSSGKLDRKALRGEPLDGFAPAQAAPRAHPLEQDILAFWRAVLPYAPLDTGTGFFDAGGNSLLLLRLHEALEARWPGAFRIPDLFAATTIAAQARHLAERGGTGRATSVSSITGSGKVAIVGMGLRLADFDTAEALWDDLARGADRVGALPASRVEEARALYAAFGRPVPTAFREAAYLDDIAGFDPRRFRMSPADAALVDPEQRLFLETAVRALEEAGYGGSSLDGRMVGTFVGSSPTPYFREAVGRAHPDRAEQVFALNVPSNVATRLSYLHDWRGPANVIDTACSSGLAAVHAACRSLLNNECEAALAGAAKVLLPLSADGPRLTIDSSTGRTRAFAEGADGTGMGEGAVVFLLKTLEQAEADGDAIHGVILGSAVNQDGASSSMAAPNPEAQAEVIRAAARIAGIGLDSLSYIEAHGTGTALGDPIEIEGLTRAFGSEFQEPRAHIGSVKGNYGHLDHAAGVLGLAKAVLCLRHGEAPPQPGFTAPNPHIDFARAPVEVPIALMPLVKRGDTRRAGVSAFGLSGINAHVVVEAGPSSAARADDGEAHTVLLSAADEATLRRYASGLLDSLSGRAGWSVADVAHTLATGRPRLARWLAITANTRAELLERLSVWCADRAHQDVRSGEGSTPEIAIPATGRRLHLPPAPFARTACRAGLTAPGQSFLGAVVHTADARLRSVAVDDPAFWPLAEHRLDGQPVLVGMGLPALVAAAEGMGFTLRDLRWRRPLRGGELDGRAATLALHHDGALTLAGPIGGRWTVFADARYAHGAERRPPLDAAALARKLAQGADAARFREDGPTVSVSRRWDVLRRVWRAGDGAEAVALLALDPASDPLRDLHPALMDVAASLLLLGGVPRVPAGCATFSAIGVLPREVLVEIRRRAVEDHDLVVDATFCDAADGEVCAVLEGLRFAAIGTGAEPAPLSRVIWTPAEAPPAAPVSRIALIGEGPLAERLRRACAEAGIALPSDAADMVLVTQGDPQADAAALRALLRGLRERTRLVVVGAGAYAVLPGDRLTPDHALAAGLTLSIAREEPLLAATYLDIEPDTPLAAVLGALGSTDAIAAWRGGVRHVPGLALVDVAAKAAWPASGCCVITGGLGGLGLALAQAIAAEGRLSLALLGRKGLDSFGDDAESQRRQTAFETLTNTRVHACDVADRDALAWTLDTIRREQGPITAVIHAAGLPDGGFLVDRDPTAIAGVLSAKVDGARHLDALTRGDPLEAFVLAASLTGLAGAPGQAAYTAANAFLDAFAAWRVSEGRPALAIDWCRLAEVGMAERLGTRDDGGLTLAPGEIAGVFARALAAGVPQVAVIDARAMEPAPAAASAPVEASRPARAVATLESMLADIWAEALGYDSVAPTDDFYALGGDSIAGAQIVDRIVKDLGHTVSLADLLETSTLEAFAKTVRAKSGLPAAGPSAAPARARYPVAREQLSVLHHEAAAEVGTAFNLPLLLSLPADVSIPRLERAIAALHARHDILRTRFHATGDGWEMEILPDVPAVLTVVDCAARADILDLARTRVRRFDLGAAPLARFELLRRPGEADVLFTDLHHAVADAYTQEKLLAELAALYAGMALEPLGLQLKDYAWWSHEGPGAQHWSAARDHWRALYDGPLPVLDLPSDRPRPRQHTWAAETHSFTLDEATAKALRTFASSQRTTSFNVVLAAWTALIGRYTGAGDIVIGIPADGRDQPGFAQVPGMMVSLLPLRLAVRQDDTVAALLERVQRTSTEALRHRAFALDSLLAELRPPADPGRTLLSEVTLSYMNFAEAAPAAGGSDGFASHGVTRADGKNDLAIFVRDLPDRLSISLEYYADMFGAERMARMGEHFRRLLADMIAATPDRTVAELRCLDVAERRHILALEQGDEPDLPFDAGLHHLFLAKAAERGDATALRDLEGATSYRDLAWQADAVARALVAAGVRPGDRVAVHMERTRATIAVVLGIVGAGAAYVPLDPAYPAERNVFIFEDAACAVAVVDAGGRAALAGHGVMLVDGPALVAAASGEGLPEALLPQGGHGNALAYIMYTSGTTGRPKGVAIPQRAVVRLALGEDYAVLTPDDAVMQAGPLAFDASTFEIWATLLKGARLAVAPREALLDPDDLLGLIGGFGVTAMFLTASLFNRLVDRDAIGLAGLRTLMVGGEALDTVRAARCLELCPHLRLFNAYGPTETTTFALVHPVTAAELARHEAPLGRPIAHTRVAVLDAAGRRAPLGVWGEVCIGGAGLADGYWRRPELTAERFVGDPVRPGERLYRTGDRGRWNDSGVLEFAGRADDQIKLRGFRIEPGEIEQALARHPEVRSCAVLFEKGTDGEGRLLAFLRAEDGASPAPAELMAFLATSLPAYMVPARFLVVEALPLNANGKIDRARLLAEARALAVATPAEPPRSEAERLVAEVFAEVFGLETLDRNANFTLLGGHSLLAIRVTNLIFARTGVKIRMKDFFDAPTVAGLAAHIGDEAAKTDTIPLAPQAEIYPASHAQQRLYLLHGMERGAGAYNIAFALRCGPGFAPEAFTEALGNLARRHETLRTAFEEHDGAIVQRISDTAVPEVVVDDLTAEPDPVAMAEALAASEAARPFDLARAPLIRARVLRLGQGDDLVLVVLHHIVGDGWSLKVLKRELGALYAEAVTGRPAGLTPLPVAYRDFAVWQRGRDWGNAADHWRAALAGAPDRVALPTDRPMPEAQSFRGETLLRRWPVALGEGLHALAQARGATVAGVGLALFSAFLSRLTGQRDMVIGMGVAGRDRSELEGLIGFFVNVLPVRVRLDEDTEIGNLIASVHATLVEALDHRDYPFDVLVREVAPRRHGNRQPLVNVVFEYQRFGMETGDGDDALPLRRGAPDALDGALHDIVHSATAKHDLLLFFIDGEGEGPLLKLEYDTDLFDRRTVERWLGWFERFAAMAVEAFQETASASGNHDETNG